MADGILVIDTLAELQDAYETFLMTVRDNDRNRIFSVTNEHAEVETAIRGDVKNHVKNGGWSQKRLQNRQDDN